jgi:hypothetical protein
MLHPELARLQERYNEVLDQHEAGNLSYDDALISVQAMSVIDGSGYAWIVDPESGGFLRATPGDTPHLADPSQFTPAQIPSKGSAPWASQQDLMRPPAVSGQASGSSEGFTDQPSFAQRSQRLPSDDEPRRASRSREKAAPRKQFAIPNIQVPDFVHQNKRMVIVAGVVVVVLALVMFTKPKQGEPSIPASPETFPAATAPVVTTPPVDAPVAPVPTVAPVAANVPSEELMYKVLAAISSGDRNAMSLNVANQIDAKPLALRTAEFKGYAATNLGVTTTPARIEKSKVFSDLQLVDTASGTVLGSVKVRWIYTQDGYWKLNNAPSFAN